MNIYVVAKDSRLVRWVRVVDAAEKFDVIRFGQLRTACEKMRRNNGTIVLVDWEFSKVAEGISELSADGLQNVRSRLFVCVNNMLLLSSSETELIRFALLQIGVGGVFSQLGELNTLMPLFYRYSQQFAPKKQDPFKITWNLLPWKKYAIKSDY
ncbi:MAG: hypothetical protein LBJ00_16050 [Planctomycetaceae bacterium]|jgi:hypothetical protein|nr:hypothetical protein [Planctomycetaceae bacterium]